MSVERRVLVLYEDQRRDGEDPRFGLHKLVQRCVLDRRPELAHQEIERRLEGRPVKGNGKLWRKCQVELGALQRSFASVVAVYDGDRASKVVNLPGDACMTRLREALARGCVPGELLRVVFVQRNTESILSALRAGGPVSGVTEESWRLAIERKNLNDRDIILLAASRAAETELRKNLVRRIPSFGYLIDRVIRELGYVDDGGADEPVQRGVT